MKGPNTPKKVANNGHVVGTLSAASQQEPAFTMKGKSL